MSPSMESIILSYLRNIPQRTMASKRNYLVAAFSFIVMLLLFSADFFHERESTWETAGRIETLTNVNHVTPGINADMSKAWNVVSKSTHMSRGLKAADNIPSYYTEFENEISESSIVWADFLMIPKERLRSKQVTLDAEVLKTMKLCPQTIVRNLSLELAGADLEWCKWTLKATGGKVKVRHLS
jgi:hypothetical protein